jgi:hypothetical protein
LLVKEVRSMHNNSILDRERSYRTRLSRAPVAGDVEPCG